jgi:2-haloacid dehalogenase
MLEATQYKLLTFDCYGTLIDWESGILGAIRPVLQSHGKPLTDQEILETYAVLEPAIQAGEYISYREVLRRVMAGFGQRLEFQPTEAECDSLADSVENWVPFTDTVEALTTLKRHYKLAILSNIDRDLITQSTRHLKVLFDYIITAEDVRSYKPASGHFNRILTESGESMDRILHVAQSVHHDIVPAQALGFTSVWINRRHNKEGFGATVKAEAKPDLEVSDLKTLAEWADKAFSSVV